MVSSRNPFLDLEGIKRLLPHRYPFLMVDRVLSLTEKIPGEIPGRICRARKNVTGGEPFFQGHFPNRPVMPGVLILEALAQTGALCCAAMPNDPPIQQVFFAGLDKVRFKRPVEPGDVLDLKVVITKNRSSFYWGEGVASVGNQIAAQAEVLAHVMFGKQ